MNNLPKPLFIFFFLITIGLHSSTSAALVQLGQNDGTYHSLQITISNTFPGNIVRLASTAHSSSITTSPLEKTLRQNSTRKRRSTNQDFYVATI